MEELKIQAEEENSVSISAFFIDYYMTPANGDFVKLYLYLAKLSASGQAFSISEIADHLNCTENDVCRGIRYWIRQDVLRLSYKPGSDQEITGIVLCRLKAPETTRKKDESENIVVHFQARGETDSSSLLQNVPEKADQTPVQPQSPDQAPDREPPRKMHLTPEMLAEEESKKDIENLVNEAKTYCTQMLTQPDINSIIYIYEQLGFSFDLCEYLLEYCADKNNTKFSFIEGTAKNWYRHSLTTREEAKQYNYMHDTLYRNILRQLGIRGRTTPVPAEEEYITHWVKDLKFSDELIIEACRRAILNSPQGTTFKYINGTLEDWSRNNVRRLSDVKVLDEAHRKTYQPRQSKNTVHSSSRPENSRDFGSFPHSDSSAELHQIEELYLQNASDN